MQTTRKKITDYLVMNQRATALELSRIFNMTVANIRHHLSALENDNIIEVLGSLPIDGKGRPTFIYALTKIKNDQHIVSLSKIFLETIKGMSVINYKKSISAIVKSLIGTRTLDKRPLPTQLNEACIRLDELGYQSQWEAHKDGPVIILGQCPYSSIIKNHPELCDIDKELISGLSSRNCSQIIKIDRSPSGSPHCIFQLH